MRLGDWLSGGPDRVNVGSAVAILDRYGKEIRKDSVQLWKPTPGPQAVAYYHPADELFYGGSAWRRQDGSLAGTHRHRTSKLGDLPARVHTVPRRRRIDRTQQAGDRRCRPFNENLYLWRDLPGDRRLEFGAVKDDKDKNKWKGLAAPSQGLRRALGYSQVPIPIPISWCRTTIAGQRTRIVGAGNPPN